jgi:hypothetical protein
MKTYINYLVLILFIAIFSCKEPQYQISNENLIGNWGLNKDLDVEFIITKNKFKDFQHLYEYDYSVDKNKLIIKDSVFVVEIYKIIKTTKDSLFLVNKNNVLFKYIRR